MKGQIAMLKNAKTTTKNENKEKELSGEALTCIAEIILNYYQYLKENACNKQDSALFSQSLEKEDN